MELVFAYLAVILLLIPPTGYILVKWKYKKDIRNFGSGNPGGTNVWRTFGWKDGLITIIIDAGRSAGVLTAIIFIISIYFPELGPNQIFFVKAITGIVIILINIFYPFLSGKGGKGIATGLGIVIALNFSVAFIALFAFLLMLGMLLVFFLTCEIPGTIRKFISDNLFLCSLVGAITACIFSFFEFESVSEVMFFPLIIPLVIYSHRKNIKDFFKKNPS